MMGNRPVLKPAESVSMVMEQFVRLMIDCGMPKTDMDLLNASGSVTGELIGKDLFRVIQFTGSSRVAEILSKQTHGKVRIEDAGFDWKILGPDVQDVDYVAWQADQDAYACSGQKCSAQSIMFAHENWAKAGIYDKLGELAARRNLSDLSIGPVLTHTNESILGHMNRLLEILGRT